MNILFILIKIFAGKICALDNNNKLFFVGSFQFFYYRF